MNAHRVPQADGIGHMAGGHRETGSGIPTAAIRWQDARKSANNKDSALHPGV